MRIGLVAEHRYFEQRQPRGLADALQASCQVEIIDPRAALVDLTDPHLVTRLDVLVARGRSAAVLALLAAAEQRGVVTVNSRSSIAEVVDKAHQAVVLTARGVPTPRTYIGHPATIAQQVGADAYPVILKPVFGDNGQGLVVAESRTALEDVSWDHRLVLVQEFHRTDGHDLKLYGIGHRVWAVRKPCPLPVADHSTSARRLDAPHPVALTPAMEGLAARCRRAFGLELYGVDCIDTAEGPLVVEVNDFPNYTCVPDADRLLADYVLRRSRDRRS